MIDKVKKAEKKPARENPWYVLATLAGEQEVGVFDYKLHEENRRYWNAWVREGMTDRVIEKLNAAAGRDVFEDTPPWVEVKNEAEQRFVARMEAVGLPGTPLPDPAESVDFSCVEFPGYVRFTAFVFPSEANFWTATFSERASFNRATFSGLASFERTTFSGEADFDNATFSGNADFNAAAFSKSVFFENGAFEEPALFQGTTFSDMAHFQESTFESAADFTDAQFEKPTNFRDATFKTGYPKLEGTLLHAKTNVSAEKKYWPQDAKIIGTDAWKESRKSCAHLRQSMAQQGLHEDAHFFFRREMYHKATLARWWEHIFYKPYRWVEYGYGVWQPLLGMFLLWFAGFVALAVWSDLGEWKSGGLSFANIFRFFGYQSTYFGDEIQNLPWGLQLTGGAQTFIGFILLFLFCLGLRNRFRLK